MSGFVHKKGSCAIRRETDAVIALSVYILTRNNCYLRRCLVIKIHLSGERLVSLDEYTMVNIPKLKGRVIASVWLHKPVMDNYLPSFPTTHTHTHKQEEKEEEEQMI
jgi:hypothetical protein